ncbi:MAG: CYTH domain-containing protein [Desulfobacteraceae bacterium]|nr:CYTH domain-containing protein [Desulfobacteraceae bacterium]
MATEIERKFLLKYLPNELLTDSISISQGYMISKNGNVIRIRIFGDESFLTIKGKTVNTARKEFEYPIPREDAKEMLQLLCEKPFIEKIRHTIDHKGFEWVIDEFLGDNQGLIVAEIELGEIDQPFEKPDWIGKEVSHEPKYFNSNLVKNPYSIWVSNKKSFRPDF